MKKNRIIAFFLGILLPIESMIYCCCNPKNHNFKFLFVLFFIFYSLALIYQKQGTVLGETSDVGRYVEEFIDIAGKEHLSFLQYFRSQSVDLQIDYYRSFMTWFVSRITTNPRIFLAVLTFIMSCFFAANVWYVIRKVNISTIVKLLLILLILIPKPTSITHRWWTALQVFLFGVLPFVWEQNRKRSLFCILSVFIHFSFIFPLIMLFIYKLLPKKSFVPYFIIFLGASIISWSGIDIANMAVKFGIFMPSNYYERSSAYLHAELIDRNFFSQSAKVIFGIVNLLLPLIIYQRVKLRLLSNKSLSNLLILSLMMGSFAVLADSTTWGYRYLDLSNFLFCSFYILIFSDIEIQSRIQSKIKYFIPFFIYINVFQIRAFLDMIGLEDLFLGNYITTWFLEKNISVLDYIKTF